MEADTLAENGTLPAILHGAEETKSAPGWRTGRLSDTTDEGEIVRACSDSARRLYTDRVRGRRAATMNGRASRIGVEEGV
jgi:hypothetical protein